MTCRICKKDGPVDNRSLCLDCFEEQEKIEQERDQEEIDKLVEAGHFLHCAERQILGDGLRDDGCTCKPNKKNPYQLMEQGGIFYFEK
jgi:hypothetical protein